MKRCIIPDQLVITISSNQLTFPINELYQQLFIIGRSRNLLRRIANEIFLRSNMER